MDIPGITKALMDFIQRHRTTFSQIGSRQSQVLELGALVIACEHYRIKGYSVIPMNLLKNEFKVKTGAKGYPENFSWFECSKNGTKVTIHANVPVRSAYGNDQGIYVVDVGVIQGDAQALRSQDGKRVSFANSELVTFVEAKKLVIYPMLLAQFVGIVHEIKPNFLKPRPHKRFKRDGHFFPALVTVGYLHGTSAGIRQGFLDRKFKLTIVPAFDTEIAKLRGGRTVSPLDQ